MARKAVFTMVEDPADDFMVTASFSRSGYCCT